MNICKILQNNKMQQQNFKKNSIITSDVFVVSLLYINIFNFSILNCCVFNCIYTYMILVCYVVVSSEKEAKKLITQIYF